MPFILAILILTFSCKRETQFDYWRKERQDQQTLKESIIVVDSQFPINKKLEQLFKHIQFIKNLEIKEDSVFIKSYKLYIARN